MHPENNKSASRLKAKKSNAMKEIEEWVMKDVTWNDDSRIGKLPENVTEERMFKARLFDIGKERYKYLSKNAFEMHMFKEQCKRKLSVLKHNTVQYYRTKSANDVLPIQNRGEQTRALMKRSDDVLDPDEIVDTRPKTVHFPKQYTENRSAAENTRTSTPSKNQTQNAFLALRNGGIPAKPRQSVPRQPEEEVTRTWVKKNRFSKFGGSVPGVLTDPRYSLLERSLSPHYQCRSPGEVKVIVQDIESLHKPAKNIKEIKPKITSKLQQFMKERGITF